MPACWGIMAGVCLRYKGTELSHELILISCSHSVPRLPDAAGPQQPLPAFPELLGRAHRPFGPWSPLQHPPVPSACCPHSSPICTAVPVGAVSISSWCVEWEMQDGNQGYWGESLPLGLHSSVVP